MRFSFSLGALLLVATLLGCFGSSSTPVAVTPPTKEGEKAIHPEYRNWSQFEEGAKIVRQKHVENDKDFVDVTTTMRLVSKNADRVVVESQVNVQRPNRELEVNPVDQVEYPAEFLIPPGMKKESFELPSLKAEYVGEETVEIAGKSLLAKKYRWTEHNETGPMQVIVWRSDQIPGRMLKQSQSADAIKMKSSEEVVSWE